jgi:hypothetical protein
LRTRVTFHIDVYAADIVLAFLDSAKSADAVPRLLALAGDAERKRWLPEAFESRLLALRALKDAHASEAGAMQRELETTARSLGFKWVAARASEKQSTPRAPQ